MKKWTALALIAWAHTNAMAHISLKQPKATAGSVYSAALKVGHGCAGSPTTGIKVHLPAGLTNVKPTLKPGWTLDVNESTREVRWTAKGAESWLIDGQDDEFVIHATLPDVPGALWFKVVQTCAVGVQEWVQVPASGISAKELNNPAVLLEVVPR